jgi:hypothetical protein
VPRKSLPAANQLVTAVTRGEVSLPGSSTAMMAIIAIVVIAAIIFAFVKV